VEETTLSAMEQPDLTEAGDGRRWPAIAALALMVVCPATTARRTRHVSLLSAYGVHLLAAMLTLLVICFGTVMADNSHTPGGVIVIDGVLKILAELADEISRFPGWALLTFVGAILFPALIIATLALTIMPWGARDEPIRKSFRHSFKSLLLCTAVIPMFAVIITSAVVPLERAASTGFAPARGISPPPQPSNATPNSPEWKQWQEASNDYWADYWAERQKWMVKQPWYVRHSQIVVINVVFPCIAWFLLLTLRAVGAARPTMPIARPPHCEACGYNLSTIPMESRCPECGEAVAESLGPDARPGTPWQHRRAMGGWLAWWRTTGEAIRRPNAFGRLPCLTTGATDHRSFMAWHVPILFAIGAVTVPLLYFVIEGGIIFVEHPESGFTLPTVIGSLCVFGATGMTLLSATIVGLIVSFSQKRNLLPGAIQVSSYLMAYLTAWCLFGAMVTIAVAVGDQQKWFEAIETKTRIDAEFALLLSWFVPNAIVGVHYFSLVARGVTGTRHANR